MTITLTDPVLGALDLRCEPFVVQSFQIGSRAPRVVRRNRALSNGGYDDTRFAGGRAITVALTVNENSPRCGSVTMQQLYDRILPYTIARRRPVISWSLPGSPSDRRQATVRCNDAPVVIAGKKHPTLVLSLVSEDGEITSVGDPICVTINPATDTEAGRTYDLTFDRVYPASLGLGNRILANAGNDDTNYVLTIFGPCTSPSWRINGTLVTFTGLTIVAGSSLVIDTKERTMYLNGDPANPRFQFSNFTSWSWDDLLLLPMNNLVRYDAVVLGTNSQALICYSPTWAG